MKRHPLGRILSGILRFVAGVLIVIAILWATGALIQDLPVPFWLRLAFGVGWLGGALAGWFFFKSRWKARTAVALGFALILGWWYTVAPSATRDWKPEVAVLARAEVEGDRLTIHNVRNFEHQSASSFTPRYETRNYDLTKLKGLDIFLAKWGSELMGHPVVSFDFGAEGHLAFSIEIRPEKGETFDPVGAIYRKFELIYVPADERDVIRCRTNFRKNEEVFLYRVRITPENARERLLQYAKRLNELHERPEWYNVATANCTTSIRSQNPRSKRLPWDWRILFNGSADKMLYERGGLDTTYPFDELKRRSRVNEAARAAGDSPEFSSLIRKGLPGFE
jgi:hypothetical protein